MQSLVSIQLEQSELSHTRPVEQLNASEHDARYQYPITPQYYLGELASSSEMNVVVEEQDFREALRELVPSVSQSELEHYGRLQQNFRSQN